jgi:hypothetical protein
MKRLLTILFILLGSLTLKPMAQDPVTIMFYAGVDAFNYIQTEKNDLTNARISQGSCILNPGIGLGLNFDLDGSGNFNLDGSFIVFRTELIYGATAFTVNKQKAFGNLALPVQLGFGGNIWKATFLQLMYGYQFNFMDIYNKNMNFSASELRMNTHTLEAYYGLGDFVNFVIGSFTRIGFGAKGKFCFHLGLRLGLSSNAFKDF